MKGLPDRGIGYRQLVSGRSFLALDIETLTVPNTKEVKAHQRVVAIGLVRLSNGEKREEWHWLVNPGHPMDSRSSTYNGITDEDLADQPDPAAVLAELDAVLAQHPDAHIVCHNAAFDIGVLRREYETAQMTMFDRLVFDTMWLGSRLGIDGIAPRAKLTDLAKRYGIKNTIRGNAGRTQKGLTDARDCADLLDWFHAEAAARGILTAGGFDDVAAPKPTTAVTGVFIGARTRETTPAIPVEHYKDMHSTLLPEKGLGVVQIEEWLTEIDECVRLRCPYIAEKAQLEVAHGKRLHLPLSRRLAACTDPGAGGTLLMAIQPFLAAMPRMTIRRWWEAYHDAVHETPACETLNPCPNCAVGQSCLRDTIYHEVARRAVDYGSTGTITSTNNYRGLFAPHGPEHGVTYMASHGMGDIAGYITVIALNAYRQQKNSRRERELLDIGMELGLHRVEPRFAYEVALVWEREQKHQQIDDLVAHMTQKATTDPVFLELEMWHTASHVPSRTRKAAKKTRTEPLKRVPSPTELRPKDRVHQYRYRV